MRPKYFTGSNKRMRSQGDSLDQSKNDKSSQKMGQNQSKDSTSSFQTHFQAYQARD